MIKKAFIEFGFKITSLEIENYNLIHNTNDYPINLTTDEMFLNKWVEQRSITTTKYKLNAYYWHWIILSFYPTF